MSGAPIPRLCSACAGAIRPDAHRAVRYCGEPDHSALPITAKSSSWAPVSASAG